MAKKKGLDLEYGMERDLRIVALDLACAVAQVAGVAEKGFIVDMADTFTDFILERKKPAAAASLSVVKQ